MNLEKAKEELDNAVTAVAQAAQEVNDNASQHSRGDETYYKVPEDVLLELRETLKVWKQATQNFLSEVQKAGG